MGALLYLVRSRRRTFSSIREMLFWQSLCERLPQNVIEPTEKTASPAVVSKYTMSARINACGRSPVTVVDDADEVHAVGIAQFAG